MIREFQPWIFKEDYLSVINALLKKQISGTSSYVGKFENKFKDLSIPRPKFWGGFIVKPIEIEFWQGRANRLHDRIRYQQQENLSWKIQRLSP